MQAEDVASQNIDRSVDSEGQSPVPSTSIATNTADAEIPHDVEPKSNTAELSENHNPSDNAHTSVPETTSEINPSSTAVPLPSQSSTEETITLSKLQRLIKKDTSTQDLEQSIEALQSLKSEIVVRMKNNHVLEREVETLEGKISLLVKNHIRAEELDTTASIDKIKVKRGDDTLNFSASFMPVYENLFYLLQRTPKYLAQLARLVRGRNTDLLLQTVVFTLFGDQFEEAEENLLLQLFEAVLIIEFEETPNIGEFMRANTAFTKMLSSVLQRSAYHNFLIDVLTGPINFVLSQPKLNLEINPAKVYEQIQKTNPKFKDAPAVISQENAMKIDEVRAVMDERLPRIVECADRFLEPIFAAATKMPYGVRYICKKIRHYAKDTYKEATAAEIDSLVGGFVFLRYFNPAITAADAPGRGIVSRQLTPVEKKNLTMVCKIIQNLSNGVAFGAKEPYMSPFNEVLERYRARTARYFEDLCNVDEIQVRLEMDRFSELYRLREKTINISHNEIALIHQLCVENIDQLTADDTEPLRQLVNELQSIGEAPAKVSPTENYFINIRLRRDRKQTSTNNNNTGSSSSLAEPTVEESLEELVFDGPTRALSLTKLRNRICMILRELPTLPQQSATNYTLINVLKAAKSHAIERKDATLANRTKECITTLRQLTEENRIAVLKTGPEPYVELLAQIYQDVIDRTTRKAEIDDRVLRMRSFVKELLERHAYLLSQLEMYKKFFDDARAKAFRPNSSKKQPTNGPGSSSGVSDAAGGNQLVGPFKYKYSKLEKKGIVTRCTLPAPIRKAIRVTFSSSIPGVFNMVVTTPGFSGIKLELDLNELLEMQERGEETLEYDEITVQLDPLLVLLNNLFVLHKKQPKK